MEEKESKKEWSGLVFGPKFLLFSVVVIVITFAVGMYTGEFEKYNDGLPNDIAVEVDTTKVK